MTTDPRWTDETEEVVAHAIHVADCEWSWDDCRSEKAHGRSVRAILTDLADTGLLVPAGGEVREELGYATDKGPRLIGWSSSPATIRRTITTWPDGSMLIGPWAEVTDRG